MIPSSVFLVFSLVPTTCCVCFVLLSVQSCQKQSSSFSILLWYNSHAVVDILHEYTRCRWTWLLLLVFKLPIITHGHVLLFCFCLSSPRCRRHHHQDEEINMLTEVTHLQDILHALCLHAAEPGQLPAAGEQLLKDIRGADSQTWTYQVCSGNWSSTCTRACTYIQLLAVP